MARHLRSVPRRAEFDDRLEPSGESRFRLYLMLAGLAILGAAAVVVAILR
jgi:hypothetical protein